MFALVHEEDLAKEQLSLVVSSAELTLNSITIITPTSQRAAKGNSNLTSPFLSATLVSRLEGLPMSVCVNMREKYIKAILKKRFDSLKSLTFSRSII